PHSFVVGRGRTTRAPKNRRGSRRFPQILIEVVRTQRSSKELLGSAQIIGRILLGPAIWVDPRNCPNSVLCWPFRCWDLAREVLEKCAQPRSGASWKYYQGPPQAGARCGAGKLRQPAAWKGCATERALSSVRVLAAFQPPDGGFKRRPFPEGNRHRACKTAAVHP